MDGEDGGGAETASLGRRLRGATAAVPLASVTVRLPRAAPTAGRKVGGHDEAFGDDGDGVVDDGGALVVKHPPADEVGDAAG